MSDEKMNKATFWGTCIGIVGGVVIGVVLTFIGTYVGVKKQQDYEAKKSDFQLSVSLCQTLNSRYYLAKNVFNSSGSSLFNDRWDEYIKQGYIPWAINKKLYRKFIEKKHADLSVQFNDVETLLEELHNMLIKCKTKARK
jgi:hypothetical protein